MAIGHHEVDARRHQRKDAEIDLHRVVGEHLRRRHTQREVGHDQRFDAHARAVRVEDQDTEQIEGERIQHVHHLEAGNDVEPERVRDARQQRQQRPRARDLGGVVQPLGHQSRVAATVPSEAVARDNPSGRHDRHLEDEHSGCRQASVREEAAADCRS